MALLNEISEVAAHRDIEDEQNAKQKEEEERLMKEQEKEGWEEEEEEEEEEDELFLGKERGRQTNTPKTPTGGDEGKRKKRKQ